MEMSTYDSCLSGILKYWRAVYVVKTKENEETLLIIHTVYEKYISVGLWPPVWFNKFNQTTPPSTFYAENKSFEFKILWCSSVL